MASIDPRTGAVVICIVYDGAPLAGKTSSLRALGQGLGGELVTPAEVDGRTLYFDWLDYTGGLFEGRRIRCQIVSVPGQATLAPRRRSLLRMADAVVFVGDSSPAGLEADAHYLSGLARVLESVAGPPVGFVFQANKRDHPHAVPVRAIHGMLERLAVRAGVVESVAVSSVGIRETFVFAVRLALDRVRELMRTHALATQPPEIDSAQDLLRELRASERGAMDLASSRLDHTPLAAVRGASLAQDALVQAIRDEASAPRVQRHADAEAPPALPDDRVASGLIWPPIGGRTILREISQLRVSLHRSDDGEWFGDADDRWRLRSPAAAVFNAIEQGRSLLVRSAHAYAAGGHAAALNRCLALAEDGFGRYRLWHMERADEVR